ncbi:MAG: relaxase/mobilization nuclease domain-containing protein [Clostridiales bacterium]|nr:relaxase/mobilization nuclease domain-containing protein [Clostridiales bacterium]
MTYIKYKSGGNSSRSALGRVIDYCLQPHKTQVSENVFCTSGVDCVPAYALDQFLATKQAWGKCAGTFFYHYVQSFAPDEPVTPEEVNRIGVEFASRAWPGHEVLVATHVDKDHKHNHFVINSVNHETGMKLRQSPKTLQSLRQLSDEICSAHGLSVLKPYARKPDVRDVKNGEYRSAVRSDSWKFCLRSAITMSMETSWTPDQFRARMREYGYETVWRADRKHITYVCMNEPPNKDGKLKKCRDRSLSDTKYLKEAMENEFAIRKRILAEIEHGRADADERAADPASGSAGRGARTVGVYERGADGYAPGADAGDRGTEIPYGQADGSTGWEQERGTLTGKRVQRTETVRDEEQQDFRDDESERILADARVRWPEYFDILSGLFPRASLKGKTREEVQREIDAEREAKNIGVAMGIPLAVVMLLIQKAKADELDDARDVFAHARPGVVTLPAESVVNDNDDGEADDLDEDDESDYGYDDDGEEVYDEDDEYDSDEYYDPDDDEEDTEDQEEGPTMS